MMTNDQLNAAMELAVAFEETTSPDIARQIRALVAEVRRLQAENGRLRCCGNCFWNDVSYEGHHWCGYETNLRDDPVIVCDDWEGIDVDA